MKIRITAAAIVLGITVFAHADAGVPARSLDPYSLAGEYYSHIAGHPDLFDFDSSSLWGHFFRLHYSPMSYLRLTGGIGLSHGMGVDNGRSGFAATAGVGLYSPRIANRFTITAGYDWYSLRASEKRDSVFMHISVTHDTIPGTPPDLDDDGNPIPGTGSQPRPTTIRDTSFFVGDVYNATTSGSMHVPYAGVIVHVGRFFDFGLGVQYRMFTVDKETVSVEWQHDPIVENGAAYVVVDSTIGGFKEADLTQMRLYASATLHERTSGAYLNVGASFALSGGVEDRGAWGNTSVWFQLGLIMRDEPPVSPNSGEANDYFMRLRRRQDRMADALLVDDESADGAE